MQVSKMIFSVQLAGVREIFLKYC